MRRGRHALSNFIGNRRTAAATGAVTGVIAWYMSYIPLSESVVVAAAA